MGEGRPGPGDRRTREEGGTPVSPAGCDPGCSRCSTAARCDPAALAGEPVAGRAAGYFLVPLALTVAGALIGSNPVGQCLGAIVGLVGGMAATIVVVRRQRPG